MTKMGRNRPHIVAGKIGFEAFTRLVLPGWHEVEAAYQERALGSTEASDEMPALAVQMAQ